MPVLLAKESAPNLFELLEKLSKKQGLSWHLPKSICIEQLKEVVIQGIGSLVNAGRSEISFLANPKLFKQLQHTQAGAVFIKPKDYEKLSLNAKQIPFLPVLCNQPYFAYATIAQWFEQ